MPRIQIDNYTVDYDEAGCGMPVIFIPGITEYKEAFVFQFGGLQNSYRIISYDLRRGLKRATDYTLDLLVDDLRKLLDALDLDSAVICGHSFGGLVAMKFAAKYPERTKALILVSAFHSAPSKSMESFLNTISSIENPLRTSVITRFRVYLDRMLGRRTTGALFREHQVESIIEVANQAMKTSRITINQRLKIIKETDLRASLPQIVSPTLVIAGSKDNEFFLSSAQSLYERIPDASLEVIEEVGHFSFLTRHDQFNSTVDEFLAQRIVAIS